MTQEQARQEAERRVEEFKKHPLISLGEAVAFDLISINREIELLEVINNNCSYKSYVAKKLNDLNQIKDELLKM